MAIRRLSFTAEPRTAAGTYGPADPAIDHRALDRMEPLLEAACGHPGTFCYSRFPDGGALISRTTRRTAHALYLEAGTSELAGRLPVDLADSPIWSPWDETGPAAPAPGLPPAPTALADLAGRLNAQGGRIERFLADVRALYAPEPGRQIVLIAHDDREVTRLIQLACASLPRNLAALLTFTTDADDPRIGFQQIVGARIGRHVEFTPEEMRHQYRVHDLTGGGQDSPAPAKPDMWARAAVRQWLSTGMTPEHAERLWDPVFDEPPGRPESAESADSTDGASGAPGLDAARRPDTRERSDPLAEHGSWPVPPMQLPLTSAAGIRKLTGKRANGQAVVNHVLNAPPANPARALDAQLITLNDAGYDEAASRLAERLIADDSPAELCAELIAGTSESQLRAAALHRLDELSAAEPCRVRIKRGFKALVRKLPAEKLPADLVHLRILMEAERARLPEWGMRPDADTVFRLIDPALLARRPGGPSPLRTVLSVWQTPPDPVPARHVLEMTDALGSRYPEHFKAEDLLDLFVEAAIRAPAHNRDVADLMGWLRTQPLRTAQKDAVDVYFRAMSLRPTTDRQAFLEQLDVIGSALRGTEHAPFSPAVRKVWVDSILDAVFAAHRPSLWFEVVPSLAQCPDKYLIREYGARVRARKRIGLNNGDQLLLANAAAAWILARPNTQYWREERAELLTWAFPQHSEAQYAVNLRTVLAQRVPDERVRHECGYW